MLKIDNVRAGYGMINVLWDISLSIEEGKVTTIVGPNGAGKTTLLRAIMGLIPVSSGDILLNDQSIKGTSTWNLLSQGVAMIPEGRMVFKEMTIEDNLIVGSYPKASRANVERNKEMAFELFPKLKERRNQLAGTLSGGEAQMLAMGRGLMSNPNLLIIDEPSLGLAPVVVSEIFEIIATLKKEGRTIILVEQNTNKALGVADQVYLMQGGKVTLSDSAENIDIEKLHELYFAR